MRQEQRWRPAPNSRRKMRFEGIVVEAVADGKQTARPSYGIVGTFAMQIKRTLIAVAELVEPRRDDEPRRRQVSSVPYGPAIAVIPVQAAMRLIYVDPRTVADRKS